MSSSDSPELVNAVVCWARRHPRAHQPVLAIGGNTSLSPMEIAHALEVGSPVGKLIRRMLQNAAKTRSPEEIIASFDAAAPAGRAHSGD